MRGVWGIIGLIALMAAAFYSVSTTKAQDKTQSETRHIENFIELMQFSFDNNICPEELLGANPSPFFEFMDGLHPTKIEDDEFNSFAHLRVISLYREWSPYAFIPMKADVVIPAHGDCYTILETRPYTENNPIDNTPGFRDSRPDANSFEAEKNYNVCWEEILQMYLPDSTGRSARKVLYFRKDAPPCLNEAGQRLVYMTQPRQYLREPYYKDMSYGVPLADACLGDLVRANPAFYGNGGSYYLDRETYNYPQFLPDDLRSCQWFGVAPSLSLYEISQQLNVCMDIIAEASGLQLSAWQSYGEDLLWAPIPYGTPACYREPGKRIGYHDRDVYTLKTAETLRDIAKKHNVCLQDLWDANPILNSWSTPGIYNLWQKVTLFIPDISCIESERYTTREGDTLNRISHLYNVCFNRIQENNSSLVDVGYEDVLPTDLNLVIPDRPHCFEYDSDYQLKLIDYACYSEAIDFNKDYTGREPPLSLDPDTNSGNCYDATQHPILYENRFYEPIRMESQFLNSYYRVAACYGIDIQDLLKFNDLEVIKRLKPSRFVFVSVPHETCDSNRWTVLDPRLGKLDDQGIYMVDYDDTLSSLGRRFGYLPSMIAAENGLEEPYFIYPYQELQMPRMPSLYDIGKAVLYVGGVGAGMIGFGLYRMRRRGKKKQKPAA